MRILTSIGAMPHNAHAGNKSAGFSSSHSIGVQSPIITSVFLCQKISASFQAAESFYYGVIIRGAERLTATMRGTANPFNHVAQCLAANGDGYSHISIGSPL